MLLGSDSNVIVNTSQLYLVNKNIDVTGWAVALPLNPIGFTFKDILSGLRPQNFQKLKQGNSKSTVSLKTIRQKIFIQV